MSDAVLGALIGAFSAIVIQILVNRQAQKQNDIKIAVRNQKLDDQFSLIQTRLSEVEHKLDIHNGYAEKFGEINTSIALIQKDISYLKSKSS
jgi:hypothetical protein